MDTAPVEAIQGAGKRTKCACNCSFHHYDEEYPRVYGMNDDYEALDNASIQAQSSSAQKFDDKRTRVVLVLAVGAWRRRAAFVPCHQISC